MCWLNRGEVKVERLSGFGEKYGEREEGLLGGPSFAARAF